MSKENIQSVTSEIQNIHDHMLHALKLHLKVAMNRRDAVRQLNASSEASFNSNTPVDYAKSAQALGRCRNDERMLLRVTSPAISKTYERLKELEGDWKKNLDSEEKDILKSMLKALEEIENKMRLTKSRIEREEEFINSPSEKTFSAYTAALKAETHSQEEILRIVNPAYIERLEYIKDVKRYQKGALVGAALGGAVGAGLSEDNMLMGGLVGAAFLAIVGTIAAMIREYRDATRKMLEEQENALLKFQHR